MKQSFPKTVDSLAGVFEMISEAVHTHGLPEEVIPGLHLAVEEVFVNLVRYNTTSENDIAVELDVAGNELAITLVDRDVEPYDITQRKDVNTDASLDERHPGGLGVHFVRQIMDDIQYDYADRTSTIRLIKRLEE